ncbi:hypothetical protein D0T12_23355 [Actinomadura spongiicola]|uniref:Uncharacterized protein n=1 Tax=Actinomadura spongiicola TaxID=2303421 RepID=A0A372GD45_9ACTN|nr:hypothetical protein [Actinomadura spongiicola]RFS83112.1 hypothetical protein D0T12_23355 [Actinomadura spongiicola]
MTGNTSTHKLRRNLAAATVAALPLLAMAPSAAAIPQESATAEKTLTCRTDTDGYWGHAHCTNNGNVVRGFRASVVCGGWPDATGAWRTLNPGQSGLSSARCFGGTGVGSVTWEEG